MSINYQPFISADRKVPELTFKAVMLGALLALLLAVSNTFLALKIGVLTASSIPAAILSMGVLRLFRHSTILENNIVQTCASAGEAIAGGIVYTAPALIIVHYWMQFDYLSTFVIALIGGSLGVLFTIPLRRVFMQERQLRFPEGTAIAEVLKAHVQQVGNVGRLLLGGAIGGLIELCQTGFKLLANQAQFWITKAQFTTGFGLGFSATLIGAGYLMGFGVGLSVFIGAIIANVFGVAALSHAYDLTGTASDIATTVLSNNVRYIGIGAMLVAGVITLFTLIKPFYNSVANSIGGALRGQQQLTLRTERDIPFSVVVISIIVMLIGCYLLFNGLFDFHNFNSSHLLKPAYLITCLLYVLVFGFVFATICGYFSGLVGVTASPGSSVAIASVLLAALLLKFFLSLNGAITPALLHEAEAITIVLASIVMGAACVANNNSQDLKVGHIVGATPWKQQLMLLLGGLIAALIIPVVMKLLFNVYGIAGVVPHVGMAVNQTLPAPPAAAMAAISQGVFSGDLPWNMLYIGGGIILAVYVLNLLLRGSRFKLSLIGVAIGIYLPLASSTPLFIGALISLLVERQLTKNPAMAASKRYRGIILACGLVAGAAIMNVILAVPFALMHNPDGLNLLPAAYYHLSEILGTAVTLLLCVYLYRSTVR